MNSREIAEQIFLTCVESVSPSKLISPIMSVRDNNLVIGPHNFPLDKTENIYIIGAGKASAPMAAEVEKILDTKITDGHIVVKYGHSCKLRYIKVTEAGHPVPDSNGFKATESIRKIAENAGVNDIVICLLSGGGSALLADSPAGVSPDEMMILNNVLVGCGASITEINAVRKHLSHVKGGQLARVVYPATLITLILSDVPGDNPGVIASGPTTADSTTYKQALVVLKNYNLISSVPGNIVKYIEEGIAGKRPETPKSSDPVFLKTFNLIVGTNKLAMEAGKLKAQEFNINSIVIDSQLQGDTVSVSEYIVNTALEFRNDQNEVKPVCLLFGGETTLTLGGSGKGGRNQHLALLCALLLENHPGITILSAGTDGTDGTTDAAGAVVDSGTIPAALGKNIDPAKFIANFDSFHFFKKAGGHIITGPTMTNVMDIIVVIVEQ
jgi:hydroxypyruvate reductase/glycerate 2-kinase